MSSSISKYQNQQTDTSIPWWISQIGRFIPTIKSIYLSGDITWWRCNKYIWICIVSSKSRIWITYLLMQICIKVYNFFWNQSIPLKIEAIIDEDNMSMYQLAYKPIDPYLVYWIAHLSLIYTDHIEHSQTIFTSNYWINNLLPNHDLKEIIYLVPNLCIWTTKLKTISKSIVDSRLWWLIESCIRRILHSYLIFRHRTSIASMPLITPWLINSWDIQRFDTHLLYKHHKT